MQRLSSVVLKVLLGLGDDTVYGCLLDMDERTLSASINGNATGILYSDLARTKIYPALGVGALYKNIF